MSQSLKGVLNMWTMEVGDGRDIELCTVDDSICWRRVNDKEWNVLVSISDIAPKKGVDYYTEEDMKEIVEYIAPLLSEKLVSDKDYVYKHPTASDEWTIVHNLNKYPSVTIVDSADNVVVGDISYIDKNSLSIKFEGIFSGKCYIN